MRHVMLGAAPTIRHAPSPAPLYTAAKESPVRARPRSRSGMIGGALAAMLCGVGIGMSLPALDRTAPSLVATAPAQVTVLRPVTEPDTPEIAALNQTIDEASQFAQPSTVAPAGERETPVAPPPRVRRGPPPIGSPERPEPVAYGTPPAPAAAAEVEVGRVERPRAPTREQVLAADRDLRRAWQEAVNAGAPRDVMVDYRRRWTRLNRESADDSARLIRNYRQMTDELNRATFFTDDAVG